MSPLFHWVERAPNVLSLDIYGGNILLHHVCTEVEAAHIPALECMKRVYGSKLELVRGVKPNYSGLFSPCWRAIKIYLYTPNCRQKAFYDRLTVGKLSYNAPKGVFVSFPFKFPLNFRSECIQYLCMQYWISFWWLEVIKWMIHGTNFKLSRGCPLFGGRKSETCPPTTGTLWDGTKTFFGTLWGHSLSNDTSVY